MTRLSASGALERFALALISIAGFFNFFRVGFLVLNEPHLLNFTEGISLHSANTILAGQTLYGEINLPPFSYLAYPPGYPLVCASLVAFWGNSLLPLRLFSLLAEIVVLLSCFFAVRAYGLGASFSLPVTCWLAGLLSIHRFHALARVDFPLMAVLGLIGLSAIFLSRPQPLNKHGQLVCFVCIFVMVPVALILKLSAIFEVVWLLLFFGLSRGLPHRHEGLAALSAGLLLGIGLVSLINVRTGGYLWQHLVVLQGHSGVDPHWQWGPFRKTFLLYLPLLVPLFMGLFARRKMLLPVWMAWGNLMWFFLSSLKRGSDVNYNIPLLFWLTVCLGLALVNSERLRKVAPLGLLACLAVFPLYSHTVYPPTTWHTLIASDLAPQVAGYRDELTSFIAEAPGLVLVEEPYFATVSKKPLWMSDTYQLWVLSRKGLFDDTAVAHALRRGDITHVVAGPRLLGMRGIRSALEQNFHLLSSGVAFDGTTRVRAYVHQDFVRRAEGKEE